LSAKKPEADPRALMSDTAARGVFGISKMTESRWRNDARIGWPAPCAKIRGRNYVRAADVWALRDRLIALTESGESTTAMPIPRYRRAAKSRARMEGVG
jgi:hypothetical protein